MLLYGGQSRSLLCFAEVSPLPVALRQTEQAKPNSERERAHEKREETLGEKDQLAQQLSRALLLPAHPPPLHRNTQMLACCLSPIHTWGWPRPPLPHRLFLLMICTYYGGVSPGYRKALLDRKPLVFPLLSFWHVLLCFYIFTLPPPTQEQHHANQPL